MPWLRPPGDSGIALGPILFIVAILGILAAAIAASSGSFTGRSNAEAASSKASALIQIGLILQVGAERMVGAGTDFDTVNIDPTSTSNTNDLFAPAGGGVNTPSITLANDPATDIWHYPFAAMPQLGTTATERVALLRVALDICDQVNVKANAISTTASDSSMTNDIGDVTVATLAGAANWPTPLLGKESGCLRNTNVTTPGYFYFQILGIR